MKQWLINRLRSFENWLDRYSAPKADELVLSLVLNTSSLELVKNEFVEFAPIKGCCGPFKLYGNSLPVFEYTVFHQPIMEFVKIRVEVARPDRISFHAAVESKGTLDSARHGEEIAVIDRFKAPFNRLALNLFYYFPYYRKKLIQEVTPDESMAKPEATLCSKEA